LGHKVVCLASYVILVLVLLLVAPVCLIDVRLFLDVVE
jgi:hypothetical protein